MFLTWVNIFQLNNLRWNEPARLFSLAGCFHFSASVSLRPLCFLEFQHLSFFLVVFFFYCVVFGGGTRTIFANYQGINPIRLKRQKNDQTPDERFKMKNISVKQLGAFFIAAGILDGSS